MAKKSAIGNETFYCSVVSPEKTHFQGDEKAVQIPTDKGAAVILPGHTPMIINLEAGIIRVMNLSWKSQTDFYTSGGFAEITNDKIVLLVQTLVPVNDLDLSEIKMDLERHDDRLGDAGGEEDNMDEVERIRAEVKILRAKLFSIEAAKESFVL